MIRDKHFRNRRVRPERVQSGDKIWIRGTGMKEQEDLKRRKDANAAAKKKTERMIVRLRRIRQDVERMYSQQKTQNTPSGVLHSLRKLLH
jgi:hypothetical protein